jgi:hypothetical protein
MQLDEALAVIDDATQTTRHQKFSEQAIECLRASTDDRAVEALLHLFEWAKLRSCEPAKSALMHSAHPEVALRIADRLETWWKQEVEEHTRLCVSHAGAVLAALGDARVLPQVQEIGRLAEEAEDNIVLRGMLFARVGIGDESAQQEVRTHYLTGPAHQGADAYPEKLLGVVSPEAYFDTFAPIVREYQEGDNSLGSKASKLLFHLTSPAHEYRGTERVHKPLPPRDPRWLELGVELMRERPRPVIFGYAPQLLDIDHPRREQLLEALPTSAIGSEPNPVAALLDGLPAEFEQLRAKAAWRLFSASGVVWLHAAALKLGEVEALFDALGEAKAAQIRGFSLAGRKLNAQAFAKLFRWPGLGRFTHLSLASMPNLKVAELRQLAASEHVAQLEHLDLKGLVPSKPPFKALARREVFPNLHTLLLAPAEGVEPTEAALAPLFSGSLRVRRLTLIGYRIDRAVLELAGSEFGRELEELAIPGQYPVSRTVAQMLSLLGEQGGKLRRLELPNCFNNLSPSSWVVENGHELETLSELVLDGAATESLFEALADAPFLPRLRSLSLARAGVPSQRFAPMLEVEMPSLVELSLNSAAGVNADWLRELARAPASWITQLERLDLRGPTDLRAGDIDLLPESAQAAVRAVGWPY